MPSVDRFLTVRVGKTHRRVRALETPAETGFRDLLGHWVFEDDSGALVDGAAMSEGDRSAVIAAASRKDDSR